MGVTRLDDGRTAEDAPGGAVLLSGFSYLIGELLGSPGRALDSIMLFKNLIAPCRTLAGFLKGATCLL